MRLTVELKKQIVNSVMADTKTVDYLGQANDLIKNLVTAAAPKIIRDAYAHNPSVFIHSSTYRDGAYINYPSLFDGAYEIASYAPDVTPLLKQHSAQKHSRKEARRALESLLAGCTTSDMLISVAPELEKYIPINTPKKSLPVATDLKDKLKAAGWPKGGRE